jgi:hypothetical protein
MLCQQKNRQIASESMAVKRVSGMFLAVLMVFGTKMD